MNNKHQTIDKVFADWGHAQSQMPLNSQEMKNKILTNFSVSSPGPVNVRNPGKVPWLPLVLASCAVLSFFLVPSLKINPLTTQELSTNSIPTTQPYAAKSEVASPAAAGRAAGLNSAANDLNMQSPAYKKPPTYYIQPEASTPVSDNREFLKISYSATIQTRHVADMDAQIQNSILGSGGRIDSSNSSNDGGYISFVIPADKLDTFRAQLKNFAGYRFITEQTQSDNLLPQKKDIESQQQQTNNSLTQLNSSRDNLIISHNHAVASIQAQQDSIAKQLTALKNQVPQNPGQALEIYQQITDLQNQNQALQTRLANENSNYSQELSSYNAQIQDAQNTLSNLSTQTGDLLDNVATVQGTISLNAINLWDVFNTYCPPGYWVSSLLLLGAITAYYVSRRNSQLMLP